MRKLDLTDYMVRVQNEHGVTEVPYSVRDSVIAVLFHPELKLNARQVLYRDDLARKIRDADGHILLEELEYTQIRHSVENVTGFTENDVGFIRRVFDAPEVAVKEA